MEIETRVLRLKGMGYSEEYILHHIGKLVPSPSVICEARTNLQSAAVLLGAGTRSQATISSSSSDTSTRSSAVELQAGGRTRTQNVHLGNQQRAAGMGTPQQRSGGLNNLQQQVIGRGGQTCTPYQFGLTPFQSTYTYYYVIAYT